MSRAPSSAEWRQLHAVLHNCPTDLVGQASEVLDALETLIEHDVITSALLHHTTETLRARYAAHCRPERSRPSPATHHLHATTTRGAASMTATTIEWTDRAWTREFPVARS